MIKKVKQIGLTKLPNPLHLSFHTEAYNFILACGAENISCQELIPIYSAAIDAEKQMFTHQQASAITPELEALDKERDRLIQHLFNLLEVGKYSPIEAQSSAYNMLLPAMKNYRGITAHPLNQESAEIDTLVNEIRAQNLTEHITTLNMTPIIDMLEQKNKQYLALEMQRLSEKPEKKDSLTARSNTDMAYSAIVFRIDGTIALNPNEHADKLSDNLSNLADKTRKK